MPSTATFSKVRATKSGTFGLKVSLGSESFYALSKEGEKAVKTLVWRGLCPRSITFQRGTPLKLHVGDKDCLGLLSGCILKTSSRIMTIDPDTAALLHSSHPTYLVLHVADKVWDTTHFDYITAKNLLTLDINVAKVVGDNIDT